MRRADGGQDDHGPSRLACCLARATANALDGYRVVRTLGVVRGITVRSRSVIGSIGVSGAPGGDKDAKCAQVGIDKIAAGLN